MKTDTTQSSTSSEVLDNGFDIACDFQEELAFVSKDGRNYFINSDGEDVFPSLSFDDAYSFSEGLALVKMNGKFVYLSKNGEILHGENDIENAGPFLEGKEWVKYTNRDKYICIDHDFNELFTCENYEPINCFSEGYAVVTRIKSDNNKDESIWWIPNPFHDEKEQDPTIKHELSPEEIDHFSGDLFDDDDDSWTISKEDFASLCTEEEEEKVEYEYNYIDKEGKLLLPKWCLEALPFHEGFAVVGIDTRYEGTDIRNIYDYNYINKEGKLLLDYNVCHASSFSEGLGAIALEDDQGGLSFSWCYVDKNGELVMPYKINYLPGCLPEKLGHRYSHATPFTEGVACIGYEYADGMDGTIIDHEGNKLFPLDFENQDILFYFKEGFAGIAELAPFDGFKEIRQYYIDKSGHEVFTDKTFEEIHPFSEGLAAVKIDGRWHYINKLGEICI